MKLLVLVVLCFWGFRLSAEVGLPVGSVAPQIEVKDIEGEKFSLKESLKNGPVVLVFYRGGWCPYCNLQLRSLQSKLVPALPKYKAQLVAISVDKTYDALKTKKGKSLDMTLISDTKADLIKRYKVVNQLNKKDVKEYKGYGVDIEGASGEKHNIIAKPAVVTVEPSGKIKFFYANKDYSVRAQIKDILASLK